MDTKPWYASVGIWGAIISILGKAAGAFFGIEVTPDDEIKIVNAVTGLISLGVSFFGDVLAIYGRKKATKKIQ